MEYNVGPAERRVRFVLGGLLLVIAIWTVYGSVAGLWTATGTTVGSVVATAVVLSLVMVVTGQTQKCPLNAAVGRNSYRPR